MKLALTCNKLELICCWLEETAKKEEVVVKPTDPVPLNNRAFAASEPDISPVIVTAPELLTAINIVEPLIILTPVSCT
jgi:hypothetical protein